MKDHHGQSKHSRLAARIDALLRVIALALSGQDPIPHREDFGRCASELVSEIDDPRLLDSLHTSIRLIGNTAPLEGNISSGTPMATGDLSVTAPPKD